MTAPQRFVRNIAAAMRAGTWTAAGLRDAIHRATGKRFSWAPALVKRLVNVFPSAQPFDAIVAFLAADPKFTQVLAAFARTPNPADRFPVWHIFSPPSPLPRPRPEWVKGLPDLPNEPSLAGWLGVSLPRLLWLADPTGRNAERGAVRTYRTRWVPKPKGRARLLEVPIPPLKRLQRKLLADLLNNVPPHPGVHGFRPGHSIVTNAAPHCGRAVVLRFDLADFFASVPAARVFRLFLTLGYGEAVARLLAGLCTTRLASENWNARPNPLNDGSEHPTRTRLAARHLPQGAPTSPALANLVAFRLDRRLSGIARACGAAYTRYADDLTFSGGEELHRGAARFARRVMLIVAEEGFALNRRKTRVLGRGGRQTVTGVVVNVRPNVARADFDRLKAILTNCTRHGSAGQNRDHRPDFRAYLAGRVAHVASVNPVRGRKLWALFDRIVWPATRTAARPYNTSTSPFPNGAHQMAVPSDLIVSVSGVRGIVGAGLTAEVAARFAAAYGSTVAGKRVVLARDGRPSGEMLRHAVMAGLLGAGCTVEDIGIAPTPTCGFAVKQLNAAGAIQITASHNPSPWNGLKMFGADGAVLPADAGAVIRGLYESGSFARSAWDGTGSVSVPPDVSADHARAVLDTISVAAVAGQRFRVFLDANAGAGGPLGTRLLADLGCDVIQFACEPTGLFAHEPEPIPAHLVDVAPWVKQHECAVGFVLDPDSDRLALIDENGTCVSEEATLALAVKYRLRQQPGAVAINMSTSRMNEDVAAQFNCACFRSAVGEANVVGLMRATNAVIGGEGNGGVIDPRVGWVRDPFVGMAFVLSLMAEERKPFSQLVAELPRYAMLKTKFAVSRERLPGALAALTARWPEARVNRDDGLRLDGPDWWLHVRGSNTEPVVRVIAETPDPERTEQLCREAGSLVTG